MSLSRYVLTATVTVPARTAATVTAGEPGTGGAAGSGGAPVSSGWTYFPQTFLSGTAIVLDPAGPLYAAIGSGNLAAWIDGTSNVGDAALSNQRGPRSAGMHRSDAGV